MADIQNLSSAHIIVLATDLCVKEDYVGLQVLQRRRADVLGPELSCRILLTFLSATQQPDLYIPLLKQLRGVTAPCVSDHAIDISDVGGLDERDARRRIRLMPLEKPMIYFAGEADPVNVVANFVLQQALRMDAETGNLPAIRRLVEPFIKDSEFLRRWLISNVLPLVRLDYEYYPEEGSNMSLEELANLEPSSSLDMLLYKTRTKDGRQFVGRDLRGIVGPWMYGACSSKKRKLRHNVQEASSGGQPPVTSAEVCRWEEMNRWILRTSLLDYDLAVKAVCNWDGPNDVDMGDYGGPARPSWEEDVDSTTKYGQAALAAIYATDNRSFEAIQGSWRILDRVSVIVGLGFDPESKAFNASHNYSMQSEGILAAPQSALSIDALLETHHALTWPSTGSLRFLRAILTSLRIMGQDLYWPQQLSCRSAANQCLFASHESQRQELQNLLQNLARTAPVETDWRLMREKIIWLARWRRNDGLESPKQVDEHRAMFWRIEVEELEVAIFNAMLAAKQYQTATRLFLESGGPCPLPIALVERLVEHEILKAYDNSSNGNRTRGGMKRASEMLKIFGSHFSKSSPITRIEHLIAATHSLSFYHLTLEHGVPFRPVSIRVHQDPLSLISKVLEQNPQAYTKLDDLLSIGHGMVAAGLPVSAIKSTEQQSPPVSKVSQLSKTLEIDHRITYEAVISSLSSNDFDTAFSYIVTRLSPSSQRSEVDKDVDDLSWRAAYAAGRHHVKTSRGVNNTRPEQVLLLNKKLDLLSLSLALVPDSTQLSSMLSTWQLCEDELNNLRAAEAAEEKAWDNEGDHITSVPGAFGPEAREGDFAETRRALDKRRAVGSAGRHHDKDEAPMGLFEVAKEAASAIGKTAFPSRGTGAMPDMRVRETIDGSAGRSGEATLNMSNSESEEMAHERVRKRDMVSNMVTGGFVSGLGWVLGAEPVDGNSNASPSSDLGDR